MAGGSSSESPNEAHVLIVDDNAGAATAIAQTVGALGHRTTIATTWTDALRAFDASSVDIVLMDAVMPTVDGFKLTRMLRARASSYVPIVFLTSLADAQARQLGVTVGADDFLSKPVDALELKMRLTAMLRIRRLTLDLETKGKTLARLANLDPLTGVENRRSMDERLAQELARARRYKHPLSVLMLDLDHFKRVNDDFGHAVGDAVLVFLGQLLEEITRTCDMVHRYGGEEFVIIVPETGSKAAMLLGERIRAAVIARSPTATEAGRQTLSIGIAGTDQWADEVEGTQLLYGADMALYRAKAAGRDRVERYEVAPDPSGP